MDAPDEYGPNTSVDQHRSIRTLQRPAVSDDTVPEGLDFNRAASPQYHDTIKKNPPETGLLRSAIVSQRVERLL
jgi:hypothetical protein